MLSQDIWFGGAVLARIMMQTIWITVWYQTLLGGRVGWLTSGLAIFLALSISTLLVRLSQLRDHWSPGIKPAVFTVWMILFFIASLKWLVWPGENIGFFQTIPFLIRNFSLEPFDFGLLWHILLIPILIWQGVKLGNSQGSLYDTIRGFKTGILMLILHGLVFMPEINFINSLPWLAYLVLGLLATSINRMADLILVRGGRLPVSAEKWWAVIIIAAALLVAVSLAASGALYRVIPIGVYVSIGVLLLPILLVLFGLAMLIFQVITWLNPQVNLDVGQILDSIRVETNEFVENEELAQELQNAGSNIIEQYLIPAIAVLGIIVIVIFIFVGLRSRRNRLKRAVSEESIDDVNHRFRRKRRGSELQGQKQGWRAGHILAATRIRRIYAGLLDLADQVGVQRRPSQTPLEFLPVLTQAFPAYSPQVELITRAYLKIRYGGYPESREEVDEIEIAWSVVRRQARKMILAKKRAEREKARS